MSFSVYTSAFNLDSGLFDLDNAFLNWIKYAQEIVLAVPKETLKKDTDLITEAKTRITPQRPQDFWIKIVPVDISLQDPFFDGTLKNAALQACSHEFVIQQDLDERLAGYPASWVDMARDLLKNPSKKAYLVPNIDLYKDEQHYKSQGAKWYFHRKQGCYRGPVNFAKREDGTIDTDRSDTCELIDSLGNLIPSMRFTYNLEDYPTFPLVLHYGYLDIEKRKKANEFWGPVWTKRRGEEVFVEKDLDKLKEIEYQELPFKI